MALKSQCEGPHGDGIFRVWLCQCQYAGCEIRICYMLLWDPEESQESLRTLAVLFLKTAVN